jgi:hypothetical protein
VGVDAYLQIGPELIALRETQFYTRLRPFIKERAAERGLAEDFLVREENDPKLTGPDRFWFGLDFIFGDLFRNVRSRRWIKVALLEMTEADRVDDVGAHLLHRSYLNELVVVMERLQRLIALIDKGLNVPAFAANCETEVLQFFNPLLLDKRNNNHHGLYMGYPRSHEVDTLLNRGQSAEALRLFRELIGKEVDWFDYTEDAFAKFLSGFMERVHTQLRKGDGYVEPAHLPSSFRLNSRLDRKIRRKHNHAEVFRQANGQ